VACFKLLPQFLAWRTEKTKNVERYSRRRPEVRTWSSNTEHSSVTFGFGSSKTTVLLRVLQSGVHVTEVLSRMQLAILVSNPAPDTLGTSLEVSVWHVVMTKPCDDPTLHQSKCIGRRKNSVPKLELNVTRNRSSADVKAFLCTYACLFKRRQTKVQPKQ
jgi:hypothetical protein